MHLHSITSPLLIFLDLGPTNLPVRFPPSIGNTLTSITQLILEGSRFEGPIPASLANATNLQYLDLRSNAFMGVIPSLGSLTLLSYLHLGANRLQAGDWSFMSSLVNCTQLNNLWLDRNNLQGTISTYITNIPKSLEIKVLKHNQFTGSIPSEIGKFTNLTVIQLDNNFLSGKIPDTLGNLQNLSILTISKNQHSGEIPRSIGNLERLLNFFSRKII